MTVSSSTSASPGLGRLNGMSQIDATRALLACCGSSAWAESVSRRLPVRDDAELYAVAERLWWSLGADDWLEAFRVHPRIGQRTAAPPPQGETSGDGLSPRWSAQEQATAERSSPEARAALADGNREYESRFGHIFLICASGRSAEDILRELHARLGHSADHELAVAAEEQCRIMRLRLAQLIAR